MVMHVGNIGGSRAWQGLLGRRPDWESAHRDQRVSAKDPRVIGNMGAAMIITEPRDSWFVRMGGRVLSPK
jgi:hypothetical protein